MLRCKVNSKNCEARRAASRPLTRRENKGNSSRPVRSKHPFHPALRPALILAGAGLCLLAGRAAACGPNFPNSLIERGDAALLAAPIANFSAELDRLELRAPEFHYVAATNGRYATFTAAELEDLREALKPAGHSAAELDAVVARHQNEREKLGKYLAAVSDWKYGSHGEWVDGRYIANPRAPEPSFYAFDIRVTDGLPGEFEDYFRGEMAWRTGRTNEARADWEKVLERPAAERHYRSAWAAFMLGKSWEDEDPGKAIAYFQKTRSLVLSGFSDRTGLALASVGWEARLDLRRKQYERAIELYLEQMAGEDPTARSSLSITAGRALDADADTLASLAANPLTRRVITAQVISRRGFYGEEAAKSSARRWLDAVESADARDVESAEQLALAAYQAGRWETAQRWIDRARPTPATRWLQAKLLLHDGKVDQAATLLAEVSRFFPLAKPDTNAAAKPGLADNLSMPGFTYLDTADVSTGREVLGEAGVIHLARREYAEALDALLRAGFWMDAAYVAERVLTADELKTCVDRHWPALPPTEQTAARTNDDPEAGPAPKTDLRKEIRYLLARRLMRSNRGDEAREYFPAEMLAAHDAFLSNLRLGWDESQEKEARARALFAAAKLARTNGMELLGTELGPDWSIHGGDFEEGVTVELRATSQTAPLAASEDELARAQGQIPHPDKRFHYRYQAASLAWEAAKLMPDNSGETACVLCTAGSWLKDRDPGTADLFYKSLVRRCRKTSIGDQADRMRWFPVLDDAGNPVPWKPRPPHEMTAETVMVETPAGAIPAYRYVLYHGDSLEDVVEVARAAHNLTVTVKELLAANPGIRPSGLKPGMIIFVPAPQ